MRGDVTASSSITDGRHHVMATMNVDCCMYAADNNHSSNSNVFNLSILGLSNYFLNECVYALKN